MCKLFTLDGQLLQLQRSLLQLKFSRCPPLILDLHPHLELSPQHLPCDELRLRSKRPISEPLRTEHRQFQVPRACAKVWLKSIDKENTNSGNLWGCAFWKLKREIRLRTSSPSMNTRALDSNSTGGNFDLKVQSSSDCTDNRSGRLAQHLIEIM